MIILNKEQADFIRGKYKEPYVLEPIYLANNKYGLPDSVMLNPHYREAWAYLKDKPVELITADELEGIEAPVKEKPQPLYVIQGKDLTFEVYAIRKISKEHGIIDIVAIDKKGLHRDVSLSIDNSVTYDIPNVGELTAIQAMLFFDEQGMSSKSICEMMIPQREEYIKDKWF
jgi:hypothetical protein